MTEIGEMVAPPRSGTHPPNDPNCPFCPEETPASWTTHGGAANDSKRLAKIIDDPTKLASLQPGVRPKDGGPNRQSTDRTIQPEAIQYRQDHWATFQAHHLVSGNQALKGSPMERWILAGEKIAADTGYSVNNAANGAWLPSLPKAKRKGWGSRSDEEKFREAVEVMKDLGAQFHLGPHNPEVEDMDNDDRHHDPYDVWLKNSLQAMGDCVAEWAKHCECCQRSPSEKPRPSVRVNEALDRLSSRAYFKVNGSPQTWSVFISKYAFWYHVEQAHGRTPNFPQGSFEGM
jgi:A nuclease family of the HNH/ENDO VII superfamily with conserved AHH